jgi:hypothetical protein
MKERKTKEEGERVEEIKDRNQGHGLSNAFVSTSEASNDWMTDES